MRGGPVASADRNGPYDDDFKVHRRMRAGGTSPAARELRLSTASVGLHESLEAAGPLAQVRWPTFGRIRPGPTDCSAE